MNIHQGDCNRISIFYMLGFCRGGSNKEHEKKSDALFCSLNTDSQYVFGTFRSDRKSLTKKLLL